MQRNSNLKPVRNIVLGTVKDNTENDVSSYSIAVVIIFGIIGNILVIIPILKQRCLLKSNYYVLVLQLAMCDLGALIIYLWVVIVLFWTKDLHLIFSGVSCVFGDLVFVFQIVGVGMMLLISVLRYRAAVHPLRPAISRRKLKVVCGLVYIVGFIVGYGTFLPFCFPWLNSYEKIRLLAVATIVYNIFPTIFMAVAYYKVGRALFKQSKRINRLLNADAVRKRHIRDRRIFRICLTTVLCYGIGTLPICTWGIVFFASVSISLKYPWLQVVGIVLQVAGSNAAIILLYTDSWTNNCAHFGNAASRTHGDHRNSSCSNLARHHYRFYPRRWMTVVFRIFIIQFIVSFIILSLMTLCTLYTVRNRK